MTHTELQALIDQQKASAGGGEVRLAYAEHQIGATVYLPEEITLDCGGGKLIATPALNGPVIATENMKPGKDPNRFVHGVGLKNAWAQHKNAIGGRAVVLFNRTGERCYMRNVMASWGYQHGIEWVNYSNSMVMDAIYAFDNGRSGVGSGLVLRNPKCSPRVGFLRGNNNADALLLCDGIRDAVVHVVSFEMEHGDKPIQQKYGIHLANASDGGVHIGTGTILGHPASTNNPLGVAILYHSGPQKGTVHVYGAIDWFDWSGFALYYKHATNLYPEASLSAYRRKSFHN